MIIFKQKNALQNWLKQQPAFAAQTGFVPTMGALHDGHISLITTCKKEQALTIASIFVNPRQFNNPADFSKYPNTLDGDILKLTTAGCDVLFLPSVEEMYPANLIVNPHYDLGTLETLLEGHYRPGHFQGVCQAVDRLLQIVQPAHLYMGSKDYQQCMVVDRLIAITQQQIILHAIPTKREDSGLAMSSRNLRLSESDKTKAAVLYQQLQDIKRRIATETPETLIEKATQALLDAGFSSVDYVSIADAKTLEPIKKYNPAKPTIALVAAFLGEVRLIDNLLLNDLSA